MDIVASQAIAFFGSHFDQIGIQHTTTSRRNNNQFILKIVEQTFKQTKRKANEKNPIYTYIKINRQMLPNIVHYDWFSMKITNDRDVYRNIIEFKICCFVSALVRGFFFSLYVLLFFFLFF